MGSLELGPEADMSQFEPLLTSENIEQLEATFVAQVQVCSGGPWWEEYLCVAQSVGQCSVHPDIPCPFLPGKCNSVAAEGTGWGGS